MPSTLIEEEIASVKGIVIPAPIQVGAKKKLKTMVKMNACELNSEMNKSLCVQT
jgi:hypothetical protein